MNFKAVGNCVGNLLEQQEPETDKKRGKKGAKAKKKRTRHKNVDQIALWLRALGIDFVEEHEFAKECTPPRRFRFDFAILPAKIAIEYEGLNSEKSGHTTKNGYTKDAEKYNLAQVLGWDVYRYTHFNLDQVLTDVEKLRPKIDAAALEAATMKELQNKIAADINRAANFGMV